MMMMVMMMMMMMMVVMKMIITNLTNFYMFAAKRIREISHEIADKVQLQGISHVSNLSVQSIALVPWWVTRRGVGVTVAPPPLRGTNCQLAIVTPLYHKLHHLTEDGQNAVQHLYGVGVKVVICAGGKGIRGGGIG